MLKFVNTQTDDGDRSTSLHGEKRDMDRCECILCDVIISSDLIINMVY